MKLPNADSGIVDRAKIVDYLLDADHTDNSGKAAFFLDLGFKRDERDALAFSLRQAAVKHHCSKIVASPHGR